MREVRVEVNGRALQVAEGTSVAAAMLLAGEACRVSVSGQVRGALCGMGICYECRAEVNGVAQVRSCQMLCREGMVVRTQW